MKKVIALITVGVLALAVSAHSDIFMKVKHHSDAFTMMGQTQPEKNSFHATWFTSDKIRSDQEKTSTIVRLDLNLIYILDHEKKTYLSMPLNFAAAKAEKMPEGLGLKVTVTPTGESKKINNWNCKKYLQKMEMMGMNVVSEIWATEDLAMDFEVYSKFVTAAMQMAPGMRADMQKILQEIKKIKGVHVLTVTTNTVMGQTMKTSQELIEFKEGKAPADLFDLPAGYTQKKMNDMMR